MRKKNESFLGRSFRKAGILICNFHSYTPNQLSMKHAKVTFGNSHRGFYSFFFFLPKEDRILWWLQKYMDVSLEAYVSSRAVSGPVWHYEAALPRQTVITGQGLELIMFRIESNQDTGLRKQKHPWGWPVLHLVFEVPANVGIHGLTGFFSPRAFWSCSWHDFADFFGSVLGQPLSGQWFYPGSLVLLPSAQIYHQFKDRWINKLCSTSRPPNLTKQKLGGAGFGLQEIVQRTCWIRQKKHTIRLSRKVSKSSDCLGCGKRAVCGEPARVCVQPRDGFVMLAHCKQMDLWSVCHSFFWGHQ